MSIRNDVRTHFGVAHSNIVWDLIARAHRGHRHENRALKRSNIMYEYHNLTYATAEAYLREKACLAHSHSYIIRLNTST